MARLLPSEAKRLLDEAKEAWKHLQRGIFLMKEPCDCGANIRHNDGGNYHEVIEIAKDEGVWLRIYDTCVLKPIPEWEQIGDEEAIRLIEEKVSQGYYWVVEAFD